MQNMVSMHSAQTPQKIEKDALRNGEPVRLKCLVIDGQTYSITGGMVKVARLEQEWYEDVKTPPAVVSSLRNSADKPDLFTFWQRVPDSEPKHDYCMTWESLAVLPI